MERPVLAVCTAALLVALVGCSGGEGDEEVLSGQSSSPAPSASASASSPAAATPAARPGVGPSASPAVPSGPSPEPFPATTGADRQEAIGGPLTVVDVRVARQDGYDRVVFELRGRQAGQPGWRVDYTDAPEQDGSGDPVQVKGAKALAVVITGVGYPMDSGQQERRGRPALPADLQVVSDVVLGATYEGQYQAFIGTSGATPFRVFRLSDPARVVVDVRHR